MKSLQPVVGLYSTVVGLYSSVGGECSPIPFVGTMVLMHVNRLVWERASLCFESLSLIQIKILQL